MATKNIATVVFNFDRETPGAVRYQEIDPQNDKPLRQNDPGCCVGIQYFRRSMFHAAGIAPRAYPKRIAIHIEAYDV